MIWTANQLKNLGLKKFIGAHCTGLKQAFKIAQILNIQESNFSTGAIGTKIDSNLSIVKNWLTIE